VPIFSLPQQYTLQIRDRITIWRNSSSHWSVEDAIEASVLQINFNPALQMRIVDTLTDEVVWTSDTLPDFLDVAVAKSMTGGTI